MFFSLSESWHSRTTPDFRAQAFVEDAASQQALWSHEGFQYFCTEYCIFRSWGQRAQLQDWLPKGICKTLPHIAILVKFLLWLVLCHCACYFEGECPSDFLSIEGGNVLLCLLAWGSWGIPESNRALPSQFSPLPLSLGMSASGNFSLIDTKETQGLADHSCSSRTGAWSGFWLSPWRNLD